MIFYAQNGNERPIRLSEKTRLFAKESLDGKYGRETMKTDSVAIDGVPGLDKLLLIQKYDVAITEIAKRAPIRICDGERVSGAATLGMAIRHTVPATIGGKDVCQSVSHLTVDFETVLRCGVGSIEKLAKEKLDEYRGTEKETFAQSAVSCLAAFRIWHARYLEALREHPELSENYNALLRVPFEPAESFYEAVASLWFTFAFIRLCGNWPGIGRIDYLLGEYLRRDLECGAITLDEAREVLAHLFIKGCEWIGGNTGPFTGSGDAQHYQNILLGGTDQDDNEVENEVTYLVLDILEELGISDFPTTVRLNSATGDRLLTRVAEVMRYGGGTLAVYNEDKIIKTLLKNGYPEREARTFANDGCWEVQIPGKTYFAYRFFDGLQILQKKTLGEYTESVNYDSFEELYLAYASDLYEKVEEIAERHISGFTRVGDEWRWKWMIPCTVVSLFEKGCIESGRSYFEGGPLYNVISPHIGGLADVVNGLYAIKKLVFDDKLISLPDLIDVLKCNWEGNEALRLHALNKYVYYGNDNDEVDAIATRLLSDFGDMCLSFNGRCGYRFPGGVSTFGRQLEWAPERLATPNGKRSGDILAANCSPTPGTDREGATAIIRSYCKIDFTKLATGAALDLKLLPSSVAGDEGLAALVALLRGFVALGGFFMQPDVVDASLLREAQEHPEDYQSLSVRVSGWNARFVTLDKCWQDMVIEQNEH